MNGSRVCGVLATRLRTYSVSPDPMKRSIASATGGSGSSGSRPNISYSSSEKVSSAVARSMLQIPSPATRRCRVELLVGSLEVEPGLAYTRYIARRDDQSVAELRHVHAVEAAHLLAVDDVGVGEFGHHERLAGSTTST